MRIASWTRPSSATEVEKVYELTVRLLWEPRDLWIGLFNGTDEYDHWKWYLCLLPCLPLRIELTRTWRRRKDLPEPSEQEKAFNADLARRVNG